MGQHLQAGLRRGTGLLMALVTAGGGLQRLQMVTARGSVVRQHHLVMLQLVVQARCALQIQRLSVVQACKQLRSLLESCSLLKF